MRHVRLSVTAPVVLVLAALAASPARAQRGDPQSRPTQKQDDHQRDDRKGDDRQQHGVSQQEQQRRVEEQKQRDDSYRRSLAAQTQAAQARGAELQQQKRAAQAAAHQQYLQGLQHQQQEQQRLQTSRDYAHDPYYTTPATYRYRLNGTYHETNQYGADALRQAVQNGYQQGYQAGSADRQDGWRSDYRNAYAYKDATFGYNGSYVAQTDYSYYFRQGFQRGYQDGYARASQYGTYSNGSASILGNILTSILGLTTIR